MERTAGRVVLYFLAFFSFICAGCGLNNVRNEYTVVDGTSFSFLMTEDEAVSFDTDEADVEETAGEIKYLDQLVGLVLLDQAPDVAAAMILAKPGAVRSLALTGETICAPAVQDALRATETKALLLNFNNDVDFDPEDLGCLKNLEDMRLYLYLPNDTPAGDALKSLRDNENVWMIHLPYVDVAPENLEPLASMANLRELQLWSTGVNDDGLQYLKGLKHLRELNLGGGAVTDEGLALLKNLVEMRRLFLWGTKITDHGLAQLAGMKDLRVLLLNNTQIGDDGLMHLAGFANLQHLNLWNTKVTDAGLAHLATLPELKELNLDDTEVTDRGLEQLKPLKTLRKISLLDTGCTVDGIKALQQANPDLRIAFNQTPEESDAD